MPSHEVQTRREKLLRPAQDGRFQRAGVGNDAAGRRELPHDAQYIPRRGQRRRQDDELGAGYCLRCVRAYLVHRARGGGLRSLGLIGVETR